MPMFNCNAWVHENGNVRLFDALVLDKKIFAANLPEAIDLFQSEWQAALAADPNNYAAEDVHVSVDQFQEVQNP